MKLNLIRFSFLCPFILVTNLFALNLNDQVPTFEAVDSNGQRWDSNKFLGKKDILIYFYPAAMTGGCTKQACAYRDNYSEWKKQNIEVIGISGDQFKNLSLFAKAERIPFTLLSDPDGKVANLFGVPTTKGGMIERFFQGDKYTLERGITAKRWTFLISKSGKLLYKNNQVNALKDSETVMKFIKKKKK